jgi:hypothetical protein
MNVAPAKSDMTFLQVAEVWALEGDRLVLYSGNYGDRAEFAASSERESFARGEGLPGRAWAEARPLVIKNLEGSYFKRSEAAKAAGLTSAVAIPIFAGELLKAVLVAMCGDDESHIGAIEVWREQNDEMVLDDGYFGAAKDFEAVSRKIRFPRGQGLPGWVSATMTPMLMRDLGSGSRFIRADAAGKAGLTTGLGLPAPTPTGENYVVTLLSSPGTPIARRFEIWDARSAVVGPRREAILIDGFCAREGRLWSDVGEEPRRAVAWSGPIGRVLGSGIPLVQTGAPAITAGYNSMVALPIHRGQDVGHIVAWYC